jgi:hypothetical protein
VNTCCTNIIRDPTAAKLAAEFVEDRIVTEDTVLSCSILFDFHIDLRANGPCKRSRDGSVWSKARIEMAACLDGLRRTYALINRCGDSLLTAGGFGVC